MNKLLSLILLVGLTGSQAMAKSPDADKACDCCSPVKVTKSDTGPGYFQVKFPSGSVAQTQKCSDNVLTYHAGTASKGPNYGVTVFSQNERMGYTKLKQWLRENDTLVNKMDSKEFHAGKFTGYDFTGIDPHGMPTQVRVLVTPAHSYVIWGTGMDIAVNRQFVESFRASQ